MFYFHINTVTSDLTIFDCGYEKYSGEKQKIVTENYPYFSFHCILDGKGWMQLGDNRYELEKGQVFIVPPGIDALYGQDLSDPWQYIWINFGGTHAKRYLQAAGLTPEQPFYSYKNPEILTEFCRMIDSDNHKFRRTFQLMGSLYQALGLIVEERNISAFDGGLKANDYVVMVLKYIEDNYSDPELSMAKVAGYLHLNVKYFCRLFVKNMGCSFTQHLSLYRIKKATQLLETTALSIKQVSLAVGYTDPLYFSKVFKKYRLISPKEFKAAHRATENTACSTTDSTTGSTADSTAAGAEEPR